MADSAIYKNNNRPCLRNIEASHIMFIDAEAPGLYNNAGTRAILHMARALIGLGSKVSYCSLAQGFYDSRFPIELIRQGVSICTVQSLIGIIKSEYNVKFIISRPITYAKLSSIISSFPFEKSLFYGHDVAHLRIKRRNNFQEYQGFKEEFLYVKELEMIAWEKTQYTLLPAVDEVDYAQQILPEHLKYKIKYFPLFGFSNSEINSFFSKKKSPKSDSRIMLFVGNFNHAPNIDSVIHFSANVLPKIRQKCSEFRLIVAGSSPPDDIINLSNKHIEVRADLSEKELSLLYEESKFCIAPIMWGAGLNGKIIEALINQKNIIVTKQAARGLPELPPSIFVAQNNFDFAKICIDMLTNNSPPFAKQKSADFIQKYFSVKSIQNLCIELL